MERAGRKLFVSRGFAEVDVQVSARYQFTLLTAVQLHPACAVTVMAPVPPPTVNDRLEGAMETAPPSEQSIVVMNSDQHCSVPTSAPAWSTRCSFQVPFAAEPDLALKLESACWGLKVPAKGANPCVMDVAAESSNTVRAAQLVP